MCKILRDEGQMMFALQSETKNLQQQQMISWPQDFVPDQGQTFADACDAIQKNNIQRRHRQTNEIVYAVKHIPAHSTIAHRQHFVAGNSTGTLSVFGKSSNSGLESYFDEEPLVCGKAVN